MTDPIDLAIIGAGPAGLAAFETASQCGLKVALIDDHREPGGRIYRGIRQASRVKMPLEDTYGLDGPWAARSIDALPEMPGQVLRGHSVIDATRVDDKYWALQLISDAGLIALKTRRVLIATGAKERAFPFPGWTLPGVMTAGAIQVLMKDHNCLPDGDVVLAGSGPLLVLLATQLIAKDVPLKAIVDTTPRTNYLRAAPYLPAALAAGPSVSEGLKLLRAIRRAGIPYYRWATNLAAEGTKHLTGLSFTAGGRRHEMSAAFLLTHIGIVPDSQLARLFGCRQHWLPLLQAWVPDIDETGQSSLPDVSIAGDATGSNGARAARLAGAAAARDACIKLCAARDTVCASSIQRDRTLQRRLIREQAFLQRLFAPPPALWRDLPDETVLCRCEEVSFGTLRDRAAEGVRDFDHFKSVSRCGMGLCQGRICADIAAAALADSTGVPAAEVRPMKVRAPLKPVPIKPLIDRVDLSETSPGDQFVYTREEQ